MFVEGCEAIVGFFCQYFVVVFMKFGFVEVGVEQGVTEAPMDQNFPIAIGLVLVAE